MATAVGLDVLLHPVASGGFGDSAVQVALIGGSFGLLGLLLSALFDRRRNPAPPPDDQDDELLHHELVRRAEDAEARAATCDERVRIKGLEIRAYREALIRAQVDPDVVLARLHARPQPGSRPSR